MVIYLLNIDMDNSVRITWLVVIAVLPVLGVPLSGTPRRTSATTP